MQPRPLIVPLCLSGVQQLWVLHRNQTVLFEGALMPHLSVLSPAMLYPPLEPPLNPPQQKESPTNNFVCGPKASDATILVAPALAPTNPQVPLTPYKSPAHPPTKPPTCFCCAAASSVVTRGGRPSLAAADCTRMDPAAAPLRPRDLTLGFCAFRPLLPPPLAAAADGEVGVWVPSSSAGQQQAILILFLFVMW